MKKLLFILAFAAVSCTTETDSANDQFCGTVTQQHNSMNDDGKGYHDSIVITNSAGVSKSFDVPDRFAYPLGSQACK